jgi:ATP-dependent helicase/nuclease subunit B
MKGLYAIPLGIPFLPTLVETLIEETKSDTLSLARYLVILPTRRGCMMLQNAFFKATPNGCRILPRIMALADIEEGEALPEYIPAHLFPSAMPTWQRLGLMSQLVLAFEKQKDGGNQNPAGAVRLAQELMRLVDEVETTGLKLGDLKTLVGAVRLLKDFDRSVAPDFRTSRLYRTRSQKAVDFGTSRSPLAPYLSSHIGRNNGYPASNGSIS